jgi:hypothetical protein
MVWTGAIYAGRRPEIWPGENIENCIKKIRSKALN